MPECWNATSRLLSQWKQCHAYAVISPESTCEYLSLFSSNLLRTLATRVPLGFVCKTQFSLHVPQNLLNTILNRYVTGTDYIPSAPLLALTPARMRVHVGIGRSCARSVIPRWAKRILCHAVITDLTTAMVSLTLKHYRHSVKPGSISPSTG